MNSEGHICLYMVPQLLTFKILQCYYHFRGILAIVVHLYTGSGMANQLNLADIRYMMSVVGKSTCSGLKTGLYISYPGGNAVR